MLSLLTMVGVALFCMAWLLFPLRWVRGFADQHRVWLAERAAVPVVRPYRPLPDGRSAALRTTVTDRATYRDLL